MKESKITKISDEEYFGIEGYVNASTLKNLYRKSPKHYQADLDNPRPDPRVFVLGSAVHCYLLEQSEFEDRYVVMPEFEPTDGKEYKNFKTTKNYKEQVAAWKLDNADKVTLTSEEFGLCLLLWKSYVESPFYSLCRQGSPEVTILTEVRGVKAKGKFDLLIDLGGEVFIIDLKTTSDASPEAFQKSIFNYDYDLAASWYSSMIKALPDYANKEVRFMWLAIEKSPPFSACMYEASSEVLQNGNAKCSKALAKFKEWQAVGGARGYDSEEEVMLVKVPAWGRA